MITILVQALRFARTEAIYLLVVLGGFCAMMAGVLLDGIGVHHLFHDPASEPAPVGCSDALTNCVKLISLGLLASPSFYTQFYLCIFTGTVYAFWLSRSWRPTYATTLSGSLHNLAAFAIFPAFPLSVALVAPPEGAGRFHPAHALLGSLTGLFMTWLWLLLLTQQRRRIASSAAKQRGWAFAILNADTLLPATLLGVALLTGLSVSTPFDGIVVLLCAFTLLYWILVSAPGWIFWGVLLAVPAYHALNQWIAPIDLSRAPYRIAALETALRDPTIDVTLEVECTAAPPTPSPAFRIAPQCLLAARKSQFDVWTKQHQLASSPPKLVILMISGGAYRAAFWAASVLDELIRLSAPKAPLEGLAHSVQLVTGASGGMVTGAYFALYFNAAMTAEKRPLETLMVRDIRSSAHDAKGAVGHTIVDPLQGPIDGLTSVARHLALFDLRDLWFPRRSGTDRGHELEAQWPQLAKFSFTDLAERNRQGTAPGLILTPTNVETGQPIYITPLQFSDMTRQSERIFLFDRLPAAQRRLSVATAVRLNAAFPIITPAATIPASAIGKADSEPRRLVDAGFFDNQGTDAAIGFLLQDTVMNWVKANNARVVVIEIDAWPDALSPSRPPRTGVWSEVLPSLEFISAPISTVLSTRSLGAEFRDRRAWQLVRDRYNQLGMSSKFEKVTFRNVAPVSMSWYLTPQERENITKQICAKHNREAFEDLAAAWSAIDSRAAILDCPPGP